MENLDWEESCNCTFYLCKYFNYKDNKCIRKNCIKLENEMTTKE